MITTNEMLDRRRPLNAEELELLEPLRKMSERRFKIVRKLIAKHEGIPESEVKHHTSGYGWAVDLDD